MQHPCEDLLLVLAETNVYNRQLEQRNKYLENKLKKERRWIYFFIVLTWFWMLKYFLS